MASMARTINPFHPAFGAPPPVLIGREDVLTDVRDGLLEGAGSEYRANKVIGPRGVGKTVVLEAAADIAREEGWVVVNVTAGEGMLDEILELANHRTAHLRNKRTRAVTQVGIGPVSLGLAKPESEQLPGWRVQMEQVLDELEHYGTGGMLPP